MIHIIQDQRPILAALKRQVAGQIGNVRADSRRSASPSVEVARAALRGYAFSNAVAIAKYRADHGLRTDEKEVSAIAEEHLEALAYASGFRSDGQEVWRVDSEDRRLDAEGSYVLSGDLTDRDRNPIRRPSAARVLMNAFPRRSVPAWAERATRVTVTGEGEAVTIRPGATDLPVVDVDASEDGVNVFMAGTQTVRPWGLEMSEVRFAINVEAEKLEQTREAHEKWATRITTSGLAGTSAVGAEQLAIPTTPSPLDYSTALTMDQIRADFLDWLQALTRGPSGEYRSGSGARFDVVIGGRLAYRAFERPSNYAAGGTGTGRNILDSIRGMMGDLGVGGLGSLTVAPELEGLGYGADHDVAIARPVGRRTIEQPVAIDQPVPVYNYKGPAGEATYWITRRAGLDLPSDIGTGRFVAKVA